MFSYTQRGYGYPIVFLHGYAETKSTWDYLLPELKNFACYALDLPGHGHAPLPEKFSIADFANYVADFIKTHIKQKTFVVGHSMGGYVALELAASQPQLISGIGLVNSHAAADTNEIIENRKKTIDIIRQDRFSFLSNFVDSLFYASRRQFFQNIINKLKQEAQHTHIETLIGSQQAMIERKEHLELLLQASFPVLFVLGKQDSRIDFGKVLGQTILPQKSFSLFLEESGHMSHIEAPKETAAIIGAVIQYINS